MPLPNESVLSEDGTAADVKCTICTINILPCLLVCFQPLDAANSYGLGLLLASKIYLKGRLEIDCFHSWVKNDLLMILRERETSLTSADTAWGKSPKSTIIQHLPGRTDSPRTREGIISFVRLIVTWSNIMLHVCSSHARLSCLCLFSSSREGDIWGIIFQSGIHPVFTMFGCRSKPTPRPFIQEDLATDHWAPPRHVLLRP